MLFYWYYFFFNCQLREKSLRNVLANIAYIQPQLSRMKFEQKKVKIVIFHLIYDSLYDSPASSLVFWALKDSVRITRIF